MTEARKPIQPSQASLEKEILQKELAIKEQEYQMNLQEIALGDHGKIWKEQELKNEQEEIMVRKVEALVSLLGSAVFIEGTKDPVNVLEPKEIMKVKKKILTIIDKF